MENRNKPEFLLIRYDMKALLANFDRVIKCECQGANHENEESIKARLLIAAKEFAMKYSKLQSKYVKLLFLEDLREVAGEKTAELCLKFMEKERE